MNSLSPQRQKAAARSPTTTIEIRICPPLAGKTSMVDEPWILGEPGLASLLRLWTEVSTQ